VSGGAAGGATIGGEAFADLLAAHGVEFAAGVPCSMVEDLLVALERRPGLPYLPAVREDAAVAAAAGAWLAGRFPLVVMQNSGLGTSLNALVSLSLLYRLPAILLVTWRGHGGRDAPEHLVMGDISPRLLELCGIPHRVLSGARAAGDLGWARAEAERRSQPVALLLPPGVLATGQAAPTGAPTAGAAPVGAGDAPGGADTPLRPELSRLDALRAALAPLRREPVIHANGYVGRESFAVKDREASFYMIGSMGCAAAIGLGIALARPDLPTVVFDGDGNLLMSLGVLAMIGGEPLAGRGRPARLVHVVFDNGVYGSTGNQRSPGAHLRLDRVAAAAGYPRAAALTDAADIEEAVAAALQAEGPSFLLVKVTAEEQPVPRIPYPPEALRDRFRRALGAA
jgi:phosphonopyruvate decarboxylase